MSDEKPKAKPEAPVYRRAFRLPVAWEHPQDNGSVMHTEALQRGLRPVGEARREKSEPEKGDTGYRLDTWVIPCAEAHSDEARAVNDRTAEQVREQRQAAVHTRAEKTG